MRFGRFHGPSQVSLAFWWFPWAKPGFPRFLMVSIGQARFSLVFCLPPMGEQGPRRRNNAGCDRSRLGCPLDASMGQARFPLLSGGSHGPGQVSLAFWWFPSAKLGFPLFFACPRWASKVPVGETMLVAIGVVWDALWTLPWAKPGFPCFLVVPMGQARFPLLSGGSHGPSQVSLAF